MVGELKALLPPLDGRAVWSGFEKRSSHQDADPQRPNLPAYEHQVDLYWKTGIVLYVNIANAKWRAEDKVDAGALAAAEDHGIVPHLVTPTVDTSALPAQERTAIQASLSELAAQSEVPLYRQEVVHRGVDIVEGKKSSSQPATVPTSWSGGTPFVRTTAVPAAPTNRSVDGAQRRGDIGSGRGFGPITKK